MEEEKTRTVRVVQVPRFLKESHWGAFQQLSTTTSTSKNKDNIMRLVKIPTLSAHALHTGPVRAFHQQRLAQHRMDAFEAPAVAVRRTKEEKNMVCEIHGRTFGMVNKIMQLEGLPHLQRPLTRLFMTNLKPDLSVCADQEEQDQMVVQGMAEQTAALQAQHPNVRWRRSQWDFVQLPCGFHIRPDRKETRSHFVEFRMASVLRMIQGNGAQDFIDAFSSSATVMSAVMQEFTYMRVGRCHYGGLCDGSRYWLLYTPDGVQLEVSEAIRCDVPGTDDRLSVNEVYIYGILSELESQPLPPLPCMPRPWPDSWPPRQVAPGGGGGGGGGGSGGGSGDGGGSGAGAGAGDGGGGRQLRSSKRNRLGRGEEPDDGQPSGSGQGAGASSSVAHNRCTAGDAACRDSAGGAYHRQSDSSSSGGSSRSNNNSSSSRGRPTAARPAAQAQAPPGYSAATCLPHTPSAPPPATSQPDSQDFLASHVTVGDMEYRLLSCADMELQERIGSGQTGQVLRARVDGQVCAFKHADLNNSSEAVELLEDEDKMYVHLSHTAPELLGSVLPRRISSGYCFFGCAFYLAVEYVEEAVTAAEVKQWGMDKVQHCYSLAKRALEQLHAAGVGHGDIRAPNILIVKAEKVRLIDLGRAYLSPTKKQKAAEHADLRKIFEAST